MRRHDLKAGNGSIDLLAARVSVPDLRLYAYPQREFVGWNEKGSVMRFIDRGLSAGFTAELELDAGGLIEVYPELAHRVD